jgi:pimeloyl-ACP methyl ester carboxylesterase
VKNVGQNQKFDIIAHSMGGLVTRIYMDKFPSAKSLQQVIYLGTPFLGSMNTFGTIKEGWGWPFTNLAGGQALVTRVALSFPAMLEMRGPEAFEKLDGSVVKTCSCRCL